MPDLVRVDCRCSPEAYSSVIWKCKIGIIPVVIRHIIINLIIGRTSITALGIELLCLIGTEIGENIGSSILVSIYTVSLSHILRDLY